MSERDYLWDRSGTPDPELEAIERGLAPLGDEAEALLDAIDFEALAARGETQRAASLGPSGAKPGEGVVLQLPAIPELEASAGVEPDPRGRRGGLWMVAAAAVLLALSGLTLIGADERGRASDAGPAAVAGHGGAASHVELAVVEIDTARGAERAHARAQLGPIHEALARCLAPVREAAILELRARLGPAGVEIERIRVRGAELDEGRRACLRELLSSWDAGTLGVGTLDLELRLSPPAGRP